MTTAIQFLPGVPHDGLERYLKDHAHDFAQQRARAKAVTQALKNGAAKGVVGVTKAEQQSRTRAKGAIYNQIVKSFENDHVAIAKHANAVLEEWDSFTRSYLGTLGADTSEYKERLNNITLLHNIAFGNGLADGSATGRIHVLEHICNANSELTQNKDTRELNHVLQAALLDKWITLRSSYGLDASTVREPNISDAVKQKRSLALTSRDGQILTSMLWALNSKIVDIIARNIVVALKNHRHNTDYHDEAITYCFEIFRRMLFKFHEGGQQFSSSLFGYGLTVKSAISLLKKEVSPRHTSSLDAKQSDGKNLHEVIADQSTREPDIDAEAVRKALERMPKKQAALLRQRFYEGLTLKTLGDADGVSVEAIRLREKSALKNLLDNIIARESEDLNNGETISSPSRR